MKRGYTLIEVLVFFGLFSILIIVLSNVFLSIMDVKKESESSASIQQDANYLLARFMYDIPRASAIYQPATVGENDTVLNLMINGVNYVYSQLNNNLVLTNNQGANQQLNSVRTSVSNLNFQRIGNIDNRDTIKIKFTLSSRIIQGTQRKMKNFEVVIGLR